MLLNSLLANFLGLFEVGSEISAGDIFLRIGMSVILGGIIGIEREWHGRPAGLRTHILVSVGACLVTLVSMYGFGDASDPARLAAQVVSGIGFLGAGAIIRDKGDVTGITTASTIWITGMIGLACGNGFFIGAAAATIISLITLVLLRALERIIGKRTNSIEVIGDSTHPLLKEVVEICDQYGLVLTNIQAKVIEYGKIEAIKLTADFVRGSNKETIKKCITQVDEELKPYSIFIK